MRIHDHYDHEDEMNNRIDTDLLLAERADRRQAALDTPADLSRFSAFSALETLGDSLAVLHAAEVQLIEARNHLEAVEASIKGRIRAELEAVRAALGQVPERFGFYGLEIDVDAGWHFLEDPLGAISISEEVCYPSIGEIAADHCWSEKRPAAGDLPAIEFETAKVEQITACEVAP